MNDINYQLRESYNTLLSGNILISGLPIPFYYSQLPTADNVNNYILINTIYSSGFNTDCANMTRTTVQLMIVTKAYDNNSGADCDSIAGQILSIINPNPRASPVQITDGQVISTDTVQDRVITGLTDGQKKLINRVLDFQHTIAHSN